MDELVPTTEALPTRENWAEIDEFELSMLATQKVIDLPLKHRFTPGIYTREIFMPKGSIATSKIHKIEHPFVVTQGKVSVYIPGIGVEHIEAPYIGITKAGTRRVLYMHEDTVWITFHPNEENETDLEKIEAKLLERHELPDGTTSYERYSKLLSEQELEVAEMQKQLDYGGAP